MIWLLINLILMDFFFKDIDIGGDLKLKILQNDKHTEQEKSLTLKPFDVPELQEIPLPKQDSKSKSEKAELAKNNHDKTKREVPNEINTDHEPISALTLAREGAETKKDNSVVETKPGITAFVGFCSLILSYWCSTFDVSYPSWAAALKWTVSLSTF